MKGALMMFKPITTLEEVDALDNDLLVAGYRAGLSDQPDYTQKSQAYWHGFNNGQVDSGRTQASEEQRLLAHNTFEVMFQRIFGTTH
jgi:hypothetical protein